MVSCETLWICLLAVASLFGGINTLPISPSENMPTNQMEQLATDGSSLQLRGSEAWLWASGRRVESTAVSPAELHGGPEVTLASAKARPGSEGEALSGQAGGDDSRDVLMLKRTEGDTHGGIAAENNQRKVRGIKEGPNQGVLLNGRARKSRAGYRESGLPAVQNPHSLHQVERAGRVDSVAMDFSGTVPQTPYGGEVLEPAVATKQSVSEATLNFLSPSQVPLGQELSSEEGIQTGPQVTTTAQAKDLENSRAQSQAGLPELDALLSARDEPGVEGNDRGAETAKKPNQKQLGVLENGFQTISSEDMANASEPSLSRAASSEKTRSRQTAATDSIQQSTSLVSDMRESEAAPINPIPHPHLISSTSTGESRAGASPAPSGPPEGLAGPMATMAPQGGNPGTELGVTALPRALQQSAVVKTSIPSSTGPEAGVTPPIPATPTIETRTRGENQSFPALPVWHDNATTPTPKDILLIFKPLDDTLSEVVVTAAPRGNQQASQLSSITADAQNTRMGPELIATVTADGGPSQSGAAPPALPSGPLLPWQTSGTKMSEALSPSTLSLFTALPPGPLQDDGILYSKELGMTDTPTGTTKEYPSSLKIQGRKTTEQTPLTTVVTATSMSLLHTPGLEELKSEEERDDEETEKLKEAGSEEDVTEDTAVAPIHPTYSHIPYHFHPGSIWVQRNQGLVHSWVEKIRDKAGYVSGMLAPIGIGIAGALFILGALYGIKTMRRKRRNGYKRQRRKHRETSSRQDRAMLLADSSEDEF